MTRGLHLLALGALAIAQPVLGRLAAGPELLVAWNLGAPDAVLLVAALLLLPLPAAVLQALLTRLWPRLAMAVQVLAVAALGGLLGLLTARSAGADGWLWVFSGALASLAAGVGYARWPVLRNVLSVLSIALVMVPALFFADARVRRAVFADGEVTPAMRAAAATGDTPVVVIVLDELPLTALLDADRQIDGERFPNLASFAARSTWFVNATAAANLTNQALPAILTGRLPERDELPILADHPRNLFTLLAGDGRVWAEETMTRLCPPALNRAAPRRKSSWSTIASDVAILYGFSLLPPAVSWRLPPIDTQWGSFAGQRGLSAQRGSFIAANRKERIRLSAGDRPAGWRRLGDALIDGGAEVFFLHTLLPHTPWEYLPDGTRYWTQGAATPGIEGGRWQSEEAVLLAYRRFLLQTQHVDALFGELIARLDETSLFDQALIVVVADHGFAFQIGEPPRTVTPATAADVLAVPLFVKRPGQRGADVADEVVSNLDLVPTILDILDRPLPPDLDGRSLFAPGPRGPLRYLNNNREAEVDPRIHETKYRTLDWKLARFPGDPVDGPDPSGLVGVPVADLATETPAAPTVTATFAGADLSTRFDPVAEAAPVYFTGRLTSPAGNDACCRLALAVNDEIAATFGVLGKPPAQTFATLVPRSSLRRGKNHIALFRLHGEDARGAAGDVRLERLAEVGTTSERFELEPSGEAIRFGEERFLFRRGAVRGNVSLTAGASRLTLRGQAMATVVRQPPRRLVVFLGDRALLSGTTSERVSKAAAERLGVDPDLPLRFVFNLPRSAVPEGEEGRLRVAALTEAGEASWLP